MDFYKRDIIFTGDEKKDLKIPKFIILFTEREGSTGFPLSSTLLFLF